MIFIKNTYFIRSGIRTRMFSSSFSLHNNRWQSRSACTTSGLGFQWLIYYHSWIVSPTYGRTFHSGLEPLTGMLLSRTSWRLYHQTGLTRVWASWAKLGRGAMGILSAHFLKHSWVLLRNPRSQRLSNRNKIGFENLWESLRKLTMQRSAICNISNCDTCFSINTLENVFNIYNWKFFKKHAIKNIFSI